MAQAIYLQYGDFQHETGECEVSITKSAQYNEVSNTIERLTQRWTISGMLLAPSQAQLASKITALELAYSVDGKDATLRYESNSPTPHQLLTATALGGVRIIEPISYPDGGRGEFAVWRKYRVTLEAIYLGGPSGIVLWNEVISAAGGVPLYGFAQPIYGLPQKQLLATNTTYRVVQQGRAVGRTAYPSFPAKLWPNDLVDVEETKEGPSWTKNNGVYQYQDFPIAWRYFYESSTLLNGTPTNPS